MNPALRCVGFDLGYSLTWRGGVEGSREAASSSLWESDTHGFESWLHHLIAV